MRYVNIYLFVCWVVEYEIYYIFIFEDILDIDIVDVIMIRFFVILKNIRIYIFEYVVKIWFY